MGFNLDHILSFLTWKKAKQHQKHQSKQCKAAVMDCSQ